LAVKLFHGDLEVRDGRSSALLSSAIDFPSLMALLHHPIDCETGQKTKKLRFRKRGKG